MNNMRFSGTCPNGLPLWLYYSAQTNASEGYSPVNAFKPTMAIKGKEYASQTTPATKLIKKTLVVTAETLEHPYARARLRYLHLLGFSLLLWRKDSKGINFSTLLTPEDSFDIPETPVLTDFSKDYSYLNEKYGLPHDQVEVLHEQTWNDLMFELQTNTMVSSESVLSFNHGVVNTCHSSEQQTFNVPSNVCIFFNLLLVEEKLISEKIKSARGNLAEAEALWMEASLTPAEKQVLAIAHLEIAQKCFSDPLLALFNSYFWISIINAHASLEAIRRHRIPEESRQKVTQITCKDLSQLISAITENNLDLSNLESIFISDDHFIYSEDSVTEFLNDFNILRQTASSLKEIYISDKLKKALHENGVVLKNGNIIMQVKTWKSAGQTGELVSESSPLPAVNQTKFGYLMNVRDKPKKLNAKDDKTHSKFPMEPVFLVDEKHQTEEVQHYLNNLIRMSWQEIYTYDSRGNPKSLISSRKALKALVVDESPQEADEMCLDFLDVSALKKIDHGAYLIPVLTQTQRLTKCINGTIKCDEFGRWILYPTKSVRDCELTITLSSRILADEYLLPTESWNKTDPNILAVREIFDQKYSDWENEQVSCEKRVRDMIAILKKKSIPVYYGSTGTHAYLIVQSSDENYQRIDLGGSDNFSKKYLPLSSNAEVVLDNLRYSEPPSKASKRGVVQPVNIITPPTCEAFQTILHNPEHTKIIVKMPESVFMSLAENEKIQGSDIFVIRHFSQFDFGEPTLKIKPDGSITLENDGYFADWVREASENPEKSFTLMVALDKFRPDELVRLNTLWDKRGNQTIQGKPWPKNIRIIAQTNKALSTLDDSLTSRQNCLIDVSPTLLIMLASPSPSQPSNAHIDLSGFPDWQATLFGPVLLDKNRSFWEKSEFLLNLDKGHYIEQVVTIDNIPPEHRQTVKDYLEESKALGYFRYHGYQIPYPEKSLFFVSDKSFDFSQFSVEIDSSIELQDDVVWVNTYVFDHLLQGKRIDREKEEYQCLPGILKAHQNQSLTLKITSPLSESQWYCLLQEAKHNNVHLALQCVEGVALPLDVVTSDKVAHEEHKNSAESFGTLPKVYLCNDSTTYFNALNILDAEVNEKPLIFDIEDLSFQDLFFKESCLQNQGNFSHFRCEKSDLLKALEDGKSVILKGDFSPTMIHYLHAVLATGYVEQSGHSAQLKGKLILIIETPQLTAENSEETKQSINISWLSPSQVSCVYVEPKPKKKQNEQTVIDEFKEEIDWKNLSYDDLSKNKSDTFVKKRKALLIDTLEQSPWTILAGETGVGKSRLMQALQKDGIPVYHELQDIENWANDKSETTKILFLDEYNLINKHLTLLAPIALVSDTPQILYRGKLLTLDKNHKVVMAGNPVSYGSGRVEQKLFERYAVPEIHLHDFHPAYIYQEILLPVYKNALVPIQQYISEERFQQQCLELLKKGSVPIRQLQHELLDFLSTEWSKKPHAQAIFGKEIGSGHIEHESEYKYSHAYTPEQKDIEQFLTKNLKRRSRQVAGILPHQGIGLNAVLIEGESGVGKSTIIEEVLNRRTQGSYVKMDASLPVSQQKEILCQVFRKGGILLIEEINSLLTVADQDESGFLEKYLNAMLTGKDPVTGESAPDGVAPCFIIATANKADREGRVNLSPALRDRFIKYHVKDTKNHRVENFDDCSASVNFGKEKILSIKELKEIIDGYDRNRKQGFWYHVGCDGSTTIKNLRALLIEYKSKTFIPFNRIEEAITRKRIPKQKLTGTDRVLCEINTKRSLKK
jgi:hypothetical protein